MRKRQIKKFVKNSKQNMTPYRQARKGGNRKFRRRLRSFNRVHRSHALEKTRRLADLKELLEQIDAYEPRNEEERPGIAEHRARVAEAVKRCEEALRRDLERKTELENVQRELKRVCRLLEEATNSSSGWYMAKGPR